MTALWTRYRFESIGVLGSLLVFLWGITYGLADRFRGDAVSYFRASQTIHDPWQALTQINPVFPNGFPTFLALIRGITSPFAPATPEAITIATSIALFVVHAAAVTYFLHVAFDWIAKNTPLRIWPAARLLLYLYPGLILHTTVPLADTLSADLLMVAFASWMRGHWLVPGIALGLCVWMRHAYLPLTLLLAGAVFVHGLLHLRQFPRNAGPFLLGLLIVAGIPLGTCALRFHTVCLADPTVTASAIESSRTAGIFTARVRFSRFIPVSVDGGGPGVPGVTDAWLQQGLEDGVPRALLLPVLLVKKTVALHDNYYAQPYVVDATPVWYRHFSRLFGAISFVGLYACVLLAWLLRKGTWGWKPLAIVLSPWVIVATHSYFHVEPRYGLGAVPVCLVAAIVGVACVRRAAPMQRKLGVAAIAVLVGFFYWQAMTWDRVDLVLRVAEASATDATPEEATRARAKQDLDDSAKLYAQGRHGESIAAARKALLRWPTYPEAWNNVAAANASKGQWLQAIQAADLALRFKPDFPLARNNLAWARAGASAQDALDESAVLYRRGLFDESIAASRKALVLRPGYADAWNNIAAAYASKGMWREAIEAAEEAVRLQPDMERAKNNLAWARAELAKGTPEPAAAPASGAPAKRATQRRP